MHVCVHVCGVCIVCAHVWICVYIVCACGGMHMCELVWNMHMCAHMWSVHLFIYLGIHTCVCTCGGMHLCVHVFVHVCEACTCMESRANIIGHLLP